ncbi:Endopolyphosphatase [Penicillium atrosanguineum]|uniref:Endopolyphosphatase n=1 Tax=Penicillium atrosanguineum TaxID=1132637 RepID=A0A9W9QE21_9EURO|nr:Endopolyphosphatase [Penicillium atrosanguineum]
MQSSALLLGLLVASVTAVPLDQQPLVTDSSRDAQVSADFLTGATQQALHGRFLHITDFHPDRYYKAGSKVSGDSGSCHHGKGPAGYFGQEGSECDSPITLVSETFRWIEANLKDQIDFVIWTGDSVRHDNDERIPRTDDEIVEVNEFMAQKWVEMFGKRKNPNTPGSFPRVAVPVIPTFGNNDITPHNIFRKGPNWWTKKYAEIWRHFIPEDQRHSFVEGGWFLSEVIPGKLVVISLNTMYFFETNSAVDGCNAKSEPGYEHMEWLRVQLQLLRNKGMKAILMGHVAPARSDEKTSWDESCWQKYALWTDRYRDVIVGSLYGHMNIDHFILQDSHEIEIDSVAKSGAVTTLSKEDYLTSLRRQWAELPEPPVSIFEDLASVDEAPEFDSTKTGKKGKKGKHSKGKKKEKKQRKYLKKIGGQFAERYSVSLVAPSVVPNFFPTLRVIEYNISGLENVFSDAESIYEETGDFSLPVEEEPSPETQKKKKGKDKKSDFKIPNGPSSTAPPGPAYSNQPLTFLGWTQYFANLTKLNHLADTESKKTHIEYEVEYTTSDEGDSQMKDLTVRSFLDLATRIGEKGVVSKDVETDTTVKKKKKKVNKAWRTFLSRAFTGYLDVDDLDVKSPQ